MAASRWAWALVLLPSLVMIAVRWNAGPGLAADDFAQYLLHARSLLEGRPYAETGYIWSPYAVFVGPPAFPPGVPLLLLLLFLVTGFSVFAAALLMAVLQLTFALLAGLYVARDNGRIMGLAVTLLIGLQEPMVRFAATVNSDIPFCALLWAVFLLADSPAPWSVRRTVAITVLGLLAIATRTVGVVLVPTALLAGWLRRREMGWRAMVPAVVWLILGLGALLASGQGRGLLPALLRVLLRDGPDLELAAHAYRLALSETLLYPFGWDVLNKAWHILGLVLVVIGLVTWIRRTTTRWAVVFAVLYAGVLAVVPLAEGRYLWPLVPLMLMGLFRGLIIAGQAVSRFVTVRAEALIPAVSGVVAAGGMVYLATLEPPGRFEDLPESQALFAAVRREARQGPMRVVFTKPRSLALATGVSAAGSFGTTPPALLAELRRLCITHIVLGDPLNLRPEAGNALRRAVIWRDSLFTTVYRDRTYEMVRFEANGCPAR